MIVVIIYYFYEATVYLFAGLPAQEQMFPGPIREPGQGPGTACARAPPCHCLPSS